jgi:hypothetical protein
MALSVARIPLRLDITTGEKEGFLADPWLTDLTAATAAAED